ncbi:MAG TPA: molybdopterin synthase sulfur carrier subunit, partial [Alphaproteobacteria bacterium]|nr:molybdopterin synthase sulfur carrier subunit [Alphaproteobacteria bacterium]
MNILYFAWMREHTGCASEQIDLPDSINTVSDLVAHLAGR